MALAVLLASLGGGFQSAAACSCVRPDNAANMTDKDMDAWRLDRAQLVVSGRVTDFHAGKDVTREGRQVVLVKLKVKSVLKGDVVVGDMTLVTGLGGGDCGIPGTLFGAALEDLTVEVRKSEFPNEYVVDMCGYSKLSVIENQRREN